jgi:CheY-like chemotaxis protein
MRDDLDRLAGLRILIVEDEALIAMEIDAILEDLGCEVVGTVATIEAALAAISDADWLDGVFLDLNLNGRAALPIAEMLHLHGVPLILVTGYASSPSDPTILRDARRLSKPFRTRDLEDAMQETFVTSPLGAKPIAG